MRRFASWQKPQIKWRGQPRPPRQRLPTVGHSDLGSAYLGPPRRPFAGSTEALRHAREHYCLTRHTVQAQPYRVRISTLASSGLSAAWFLPPSPDHLAFAALVRPQRFLQAYWCEPRRVSAPRSHWLAD